MPVGLIEVLENYSRNFEISLKWYFREDDDEGRSSRINKRLARFETAFMTVFFWSSILNRINVVFKKLQQGEADIGLVIDLYKSLIFFSYSRENFTIYEEEAKVPIGKQNYTANEKRTKKRLRYFNESNDDEEVLFGAKDHFWKTYTLQ